MPRVLACLALISFLAGLPEDAAAAMDSAELQAVLDEGRRLFDEEAYAEALERYQRAYDASGLHGLLYNIARCQQALGNDREALSTFRRFLGGEDLPPGPRGKAEMAVQILEKRLSTGRLVVQVSPFGAEILLDGEVVGTAPLAPLTVTPGTHQIEVRASGRPSAGQHVQVPAGGEITVTFALPEPPSSPLLPPTPPATPPPEPEPEGPSATPWQWVTLGTGAALVASGVVLWWLGEEDWQKVDDANSSSSSMSREEAQKLLDDGDTKHTVGYVMMGVGGAALATSVVLFVLDATVWAHEPDETVSRPAVWGTPDSVVFGFQGSF